MLQIISRMGALALFVLLWTLPASALECNRVVADLSGTMSASDVARVGHAAEKLQKLGTTVRVRLVSSYTEATNMDGYMAAHQSACRSWRATDGGRRNDLIVAMVKLKTPNENGQIGFFAGSQWKNVFGNGVDRRIRLEVMAPRLRDGKIADAFVAALDESNRLVDNHLLPPKVGGGSTTIINQAPSDNSGFVRLLGWIVGFLIVGFIIVGTIIVLRGRNTAQEARRAAQREGQVRRTSVASAITGFDLTILKAKLTKLGREFAEDDITDLQQQLAEIEQQQNRISAAFARISKIAKNDPNEDGLTASEYKQMAASYADIELDVREVETLKSQLETAIDDSSKLIEGAPQLVAAAAEHIGRAQDTVEAVATQGFKVASARRLLTGAKTLVESAEGAFAERKFASAAKLAGEASAKAQEAIEGANILPTLKAVVDKNLDALKARGRAMLGRPAEVKVIFAEIASDYARSSWETVKGNGTEAEKRLKTASRKLDEAVKAADMESQDWKSAEELAQAVFLNLDEADKLFDSIVALRESLASAKAKAQPEIDAAQADIEKASAFIERHDEDIDDGLEDKLAAALRQLESARAELELKQPDYLRVVKLALAANKAADAILEGAQEEHAAADRQRHRAESLMEEAERSIRTAERFIDIHQSDVENRVEKALRDAKRSYENAKRADTLSDQIRHAEKADELADAALKNAKRNVADEEERISSRRRSDDSDDFVTGVIVGSAISNGDSPRSSWGTRNDSDEGVGGSSPFGSGDSDIGGVSDFGTSGGGVGGSDDY